jgi:hypothetical protein
VPGRAGRPHQASSAAPATLPARAATEVTASPLRPTPFSHRLRCAMITTPADLTTRHRPRTFSDRVAFSFTRFLRFIADTFFAKRYGHRA